MSFELKEIVNFPTLMKMKCGNFILKIWKYAQNTYIFTYYKKKINV